MNDETKEILIDLIEYYNAMGTEDDPGIHVLEDVVKRSARVLEKKTRKSQKSSGRVDPFAMDVVGSPKQLPLKLENEW